MENTQLDGSQAKKNIDSVQSGIFWEDKKDDAKYSFVAAMFLFPWCFITDNFMRISGGNVPKQA